MKLDGAERRDLERARAFAFKNSTSSPVISIFRSFAPAARRVAFSSVALRAFQSSMIFMRREAFHGHRHIVQPRCAAFRHLSGMSIPICLLRNGIEDRPVFSLA
jgi:hypothetical protein